MDFFEWLQLVGRPISGATILGCILAGIIMSLIYWRHIDISVYNAVVYNLGFFVVMFVVRRLVDGISGAAGYVGLYILYLVFMTAGLATKLIWEKFRTNYNS